jgi:hypothetical protein
MGRRRHPHQGGARLLTNGDASSPTALAFDGTSIWVANIATDTVTKVARCARTPDRRSVVFVAVTIAVATEGWGRLKSVEFVDFRDSRGARKPSAEARSNAVGAPAQLSVALSTRRLISLSSSAASG